MDERLWTLLSGADRALGRLDGSTRTLPNPELFVFMYVHKEAVLSSQIEGTQASLIDVLEFEAQAAEPDAPQDVPEVVNYVAAMSYGLERLATLPLSLRLIREIHGKLLHGVRGGEHSPGEFRRSQNWIGTPAATLTSARFVPPPPHEMHNALDNFERFLHDPAPMPVLLMVGIAHAQFETIHPFLDGNGRMGRLLIAFLLYQRDVLQLPLLYLSHYFQLHRAEYYDRLQAVRDDGDWEGWLAFFLDGVAHVAGEATETAGKIVDLRELHRELLQAELGARSGRGLALLEHLYQRPIITVKMVQDMAKLSFPAANLLVKQLEEMQILRETTGRSRNRRFAYDAYLSLFLSDESEVGHGVRPEP
ncbi:MAG: Fic family protein [Stellaceae bacterium]